MRCFDTSPKVAGFSIVFFSFSAGGVLLPALACGLDGHQLRRVRPPGGRSVSLAQVVWSSDLNIVFLEGEMHSGKVSDQVLLADFEDNCIHLPAQEGFRACFSFQVCILMLHNLFFQGVRVRDVLQLRSHRSALGRVAWAWGAHITAAFLVCNDKYFDFLDFFREAVFWTVFFVRENIVVKDCFPRIYTNQLVFFFFLGFNSHFPENILLRGKKISLFFRGFRTNQSDHCF